MVASASPAEGPQAGRADSPGLPPSESVQMGPEHDSLAREVGRGRDRLKGALSALPLTAAFQRMQLRSEVAASCDLDGRRASLADLLTADAALLSSDERLEARAALQAARCAEQAIDAAGGATPEPEALARIASSIDPSGESSGEGAAEALSALASLLASHRERSDLPEVVNIAMTQARIELAGPFGSANGFAGRLVASVLLGRHCGTVLGHARFLRDHADEYRERLGSVSQSGRWDDWIAFFLGAVSESVADAVDRISRLVSMREEHRDALAASLGYAVAKGLAVLDRLFERPLATVAEVQAITGTSYVAANTLVGRLVDLGILEESTGYRRNRVFRYGKFTSLFGADQPVPRQASTATSAGGARKRPLAARSQPTPTKAPPRRRATPTGPSPISDHLL